MTIAGPVSRKVLLGVCFALLIVFGCETKTDAPRGVYQSTSYNTGKKVSLDFKDNGDLYVEVSRVEVSEKKVDDAFFPFFAEGSGKYRWTMAKQEHLVSILNENGFEIVKLEYTGKALAWDKTKFTRQ